LRAKLDEGRAVTAARSIDRSELSKFRAAALTRCALVRECGHSSAAARPPHPAPAKLGRASL